MGAENTSFHEMMATKFFNNEIMPTAFFKLLELSTPSSAKVIFKRVIFCSVTVCLGALSPFKVCYREHPAEAKPLLAGYQGQCQSTGAYVVSLECWSVLLLLPWELTQGLQCNSIKTDFKSPLLQISVFQSIQTTTQNPTEGSLHLSSSSSGALATGDDRSPLKAEVAVIPESHSQHASFPLVRMKVIFPMPFWNTCLLNSLEVFFEGQEQKQSLEKMRELHLPLLETSCIVQSAISASKAITSWYCSTLLLANLRKYNKCKIIPK